MQAGALKCPQHWTKRSFLMRMCAAVDTLLIAKSFHNGKLRISPFLAKPPGSASSFRLHLTEFRDEPPHGATAL